MSNARAFDLSQTPVAWLAIRLPVVLSVALGEQKHENHKNAEPVARRCILVVDDNIDSVLSLAMMLQLLGNEVRTARDGLEVVKAAATSRPDMILLDIGMPKLNGYDACRRIREQPGGENPVIVALTGWGQEEDKRLSQNGASTTILSNQ